MMAKRGGSDKEPDEFLHRSPLGMEIMHIFQRYAVAAHAFGAVERKVAELFDLQHLAEPDFWASIIFRPMRGPESQAFIESAVRGAKGLASLQELVAPEAIEIPAPSAGQPATALERFSIIVIEDKGRLSRPARLVNVLQGVTSLYDIHAFLLSLPADTLLVAACDSGSDKAFDFLGVAKAIEALKETILSLWDRVVFFRERKLLVNVRLVAEALPVLAEISALAERKAIDPEQAEILRRQVIDGATQLVEAGAIMPELAAPTHRDFRALAVPEPKLLGAPQPTAAPESPQTHQSSKRKRRRKS
jgi:hypothetical protein